jgi:hypothetical protein
MVPESARSRDQGLSVPSPRFRYDMPGEAIENRLPTGALLFERMRRFGVADIHVIHDDQKRCLS